MALKTRADIQTLLETMVSDRYSDPQDIPAFILDHLSLEDHLLLAEEMAAKLATPTEHEAGFAERPLQWSRVHRKVSEAVDTLEIVILRMG